MKKNCLFLLSLLTMFITGCDWVTDEINRNTVLEYITVDVSEAKVKYRIDEKFDSSGIKIIGHYSNDKEKCEDMRLAEFSGFNSSEVCQELYVTATYNEKQTCFAISVEEVSPVSIEIKSNPKKIFYWPGEKLDLTGMFAVVNYSDGSSIELISDMYTYTEIEGDSKDQDIILTYNANTLLKTSFTIHVRNYEITSLELVKEPNRLVYMKGEEIDFDGIELRHDISTGGAPYNIGIEECNVSPSSIKDLEVSKEPYTITISLNEFYVQYEIYIVEGYVVGARMDKGFNTFYDGEIIDFKDSTKFSFVEVLSKDDLSGDVIKESKFENLKYSYQEQCDFDDAKTIDTPLEIKGTGLQKIYFYYKYYNVQECRDVIYTWSYDISVWDSILVDIKATVEQQNGAIPLEASPDLGFEKEYGCEWDIKGVLLNGSEVEIKADACSYSYNIAEDVNNIRQVIQNSDTHSYSRDVKVTYHDVRTNEDFYTTASVLYTDPVLTSVTLISLPEKMTYAEGTRFDVKGLTVKLHYSDGSSVDKVYGSNEISTSLDEKTFDKEDIGPKSVEVYFDKDKKVSLTFTITVVEDMVEMINICAIIDYAGQELKFRKGESYDFTNYFEIMAVKRSGTTPENLNNKKPYLTFNLTDKGTLYVLYDNGTKTFSTSFSTDDAGTKIKILEPAPVNVVMKPTNEEFNDFDDYISKAEYAVNFKDGTVETYNSADDLKNNGFNCSAGNNDGTVIISKNSGEEDKDIENNGYVFSQTIDCITHITIEAKEANKTYLRGIYTENLYDDFTVKAWYSETGNIIITESDGLVLSDNFLEDINIFEDSVCYITAKYKDFETQCPVTVKTNLKEIIVMYNDEVVVENQTFYMHSGDTVEKVEEELHKKFYTYKLIGFNCDKDTEEITVPYSYLTEDMKEIIVYPNISILSKNPLNITLSKKLDVNHLENSPNYITTLKEVYNKRYSIFSIEVNYKNQFYDGKTQNISSSQLIKLYDCIYVQHRSGNTYWFKIIFDEIDYEPIYYCLGNSDDSNECENGYVELSSFEGD